MLGLAFGAAFVSLIFTLGQNPSSGIQMSEDYAYEDYSYKSSDL